MLTYEWDCELHTVGGLKNREVLTFSYTTDYQRVKDFIDATVPDEGCEFVAVLVRTDDANKVWAYVDDGQLPAFFIDAYNSEYRKVPKKFHDEVARVEGEKEC